MSIRRGRRNLMASAIGAAAVAASALASAAGAQGGRASTPTRAEPASQGAPAPDPHVIPLQGQSNFRDLGGYTTADGRRVKPGLIFRSGELSNLTFEDYRTLSALRLRTVYDLRTAGERTTAPTTWAAGPVQTFVSPKPGSPLAGLSLESREHLTPAHARDAMLAFYRQMPTAYTTEFKAIFDQLLDDHAPLLLHCTAGKDRSGLAAALILTALGVPRAKVLSDYELTNRYLDLADLKRAGVNSAFLARLPPDVARVFLAADPAYLEASFQAIEQQYGSIDAYFSNALSIGPARKAKLRSLYLQ
jgi:protein-tyrosine phosphatase